MHAVKVLRHAYTYVSDANFILLSLVGWYKNAINYFSFSREEMVGVFHKLQMRIYFTHARWMTWTGYCSKRRREYLRVALW